MSLVDKAKNKVEELKGKVKDAAGMATDDDHEGVSDTDTTPRNPHDARMAISSQGNEPLLTDSEEPHRAEQLDADIPPEQYVVPESPTMHLGDQGS